MAKPKRCPVSAGPLSRYRPCGAHRLCAVGGTGPCISSRTNSSTCAGRPPHEPHTYPRAEPPPVRQAGHPAAPPGRPKGPPATGPGMTVSPCRTDDLGAPCHRVREAPLETLTRGPTAAWPDASLAANGSTCCSRSSATAPSTDPAQRPPVLGVGRDRPGPAPRRCTATRACTASRTRPAGVGYRHARTADRQCLLLVAMYRQSSDCAFAPTCVRFHRNPLSI
jgi:hypothetical protein